jgi:hypothetical protein
MVFGCRCRDDNYIITVLIGTIIIIIIVDSYLKSGLGGEQTESNQRLM